MSTPEPRNGPTDHDATRHDDDLRPSGQGGPRESRRPSASAPTGAESRPPGAPAAAGETTGRRETGVAEATSAKRTRESGAPALNRDGVPVARVRRAPRVVPFLATGALIGALIGLVISLDGGDGGNYTASSSTGYLVVLFGALGLLLGGVGFVIADRRS